MQNVYKNIEEYNRRKRCKVLIVFHDMIADMINNKKLNLTETELFIRGRKLNISIVCPKFYTLFYYENSKQKRTSPNCPNSSDIDCKDL